MILVDLGSLLGIVLGFVMLAFGLISYIVIKLGMGKIKDIKVGTWIIGIMFAVMFFVTH